MLVCHNIRVFFNVRRYLHCAVNQTICKLMTRYPLSTRVRFLSTHVFCILLTVPRPASTFSNGPKQVERIHRMRCSQARLVRVRASTHLIRVDNPLIIQQHHRNHYSDDYPQNQAGKKYFSSRAVSITSHSPHSIHHHL